MEKIIFIISIASLAVALIVFIGKVLTDGLNKAFDWKGKPSKIMLCSFLIYMISFGVYIFVSKAS
ncbi:Mas-related G-protein coupled receptor member D [Paenibacillus sp. YPG26]|uniref:Mas-related G-protein coupled receptor member D n=1 Tax=Paenibacillus sp. YPG26 TaxID=2878915 RepID=UPI00203B52C8|nr:Mas-related G-protein coupled receptor member D [Paenibacillus sp. YPG26]USB33158.1 Mas-related G-protein coupled receptor member D [Paenibacillus sp. YPG26]